MRVISGQFKGRSLETMEGEDVRPTLDRAKETLFNVLQFDINDSTRVLDMFAGSGSLGIESLSRGVQYACFFDINSSACAVIKRNLERIRVPSDKYSIYKGDFRSLCYLRKDAKYDIIFIDPPYTQMKAANETQDFCLEALKIVSEADLLNKEGIIICEHRERSRLPENICEFSIVKHKKIGIVGLTFYKRSANEQ